MRSSPQLEQYVVEMKKRYPYWGPRKIHNLVYQKYPTAKCVAVSTVSRILARHGLVTPREAPVIHPAVGRFERAEPNDLWQMDLKMAIRLGNGSKVYVAGLLDDHSRYALTLCLLPDISDESVLSCWIAAARRHGLPRQTLTDHGAQFGMEDHTTSAFRAYLWACGVNHTQGRVGHPQTQGKIERFWGTFQRELTPQLEQASPEQWSALIENWRCQYNNLRPHEGIADHPPVKRYCSSERPFIEPNRRDKIGHSESVYRNVNVRGQIAFGGKRFIVGRGLANWVVELRPLGNGCWHVNFRNRFVRELILTKQHESVTHVPVQV